VLSRLSVKNYALISDIEASFAAGLNLLTGETGAGKSLLVNAIGLILGRRADSSVLLDAGKKCVVEAEFSHVPVWVLDEVRADFASAEVDLGDEPTVIVRREIAPGGKSRAFVNDTPVTLALLKTLAERMVDLHGQSEGIRLLEPRVQLDAIDRFAGCTEAAANFGRQWQALKALHAEIAQLRTQEAEAARQLDYFRHQLTELTEAQLEPGEDERIEQQLTRLEHTEQILLTLGRQVEVLSGDEAGLSASLRTLARELERLASLDSRVAEPAQRIEAARVEIEAIADTLRAFAEDTDLDPREQERIAQRHDTYSRLKLKFAVRTAEELIALRDDFEGKVASYAAAPERIAALEAQAKALEGELAQLALQLHEARSAAAAELQPRIAGLLAEVGLPTARVSIVVSLLSSAVGSLMVAGERVAPDVRGASAVQFLVSTNPGLPLGPLQQVASGGEVARVMLALKTALAEQLGLSALIFDEIDTGISGEVAMKVGRVLERLAQDRQLLVITHLPQIASRHGHHFFLFKQNTGGRTATHLTELANEARVIEIAKMLSSDPPGDSALDNARQLLAS
jgi:DNA repair protein RecN (Recombination protein N)